MCAIIENSKEGDITCDWGLSGKAMEKQGVNIYKMPLLVRYSEIFCSLPSCPSIVTFVSSQPNNRAAAQYLLKNR
jgi:hypothetical protein